MKVMILLSILFFSQYAFADFGPGNGGDKVYCEKNEDGSETEFEGHYFLDYLVAQMNNRYDSFFQNEQEFYKHLKEKIPELAEQFKLLLVAFRQKTQSGPYVWKSSKPLEWDDENLIFELPENCQGSLKQMIIRKRWNKERAYFWYSDEVSLLESQISWVIMHELLWDYFNKADEVRLVNEFLHKKSYASLSSRQYIDEFNKVATPQKFLTYEFNEKFETIESEFTNLKNTDSYFVQNDVIAHTSRVSELVIFSYHLMKMSQDNYEKEKLYEIIGELNSYQFQLRNYGSERQDGAFASSSSTKSLNVP